MTRTRQEIEGGGVTANEAYRLAIAEIDTPDVRAGMTAVAFDRRDPEEVDAIDDDVDDEPFELPEPEYRKPEKPAFKPGTRQPEAKTEPITGELPWYAKVKPGESMMAAAIAEQPRMSASKMARTVKSFVHD